MKTVVTITRQCTYEDILSGPQRAAVARLLYAVRHQRKIAVLCGPGGTGVSTVLARVAAELESVGQNVVWVNGRDLPADPNRVTISQMAERGCWAHLGGIGEREVQSALIIDDSHASDASGLACFVTSIRSKLPAVAVVLAGRGRLLTLLALEQELQDQVLLRAVLPPWSFLETASYVRGQFAAAEVPVSDDAVLVSIHEITAGIPQAVVQLVEMSLLIASTHPTHLLGRADVEQMHDRLSLTAA